MATANIRTVTMSIEERTELAKRDGLWVRFSEVKVALWEQHGQRRLYVGVGKDRSFMDLNSDSDLEMVFDELATAQAVAALISEIMPVEATVIEAAPVKEIGEPVLRATVIDGDMIDEAVAEMEAETARYHAYFAEQGATLGMTGEELEMAFVNWRDEIVAPIAKSYNPDRPWFGWAHIQNSLNMWNIFFDAVASGNLDNLPKTLHYTGGEPKVVF